MTRMKILVPHPEELQTETVRQDWRAIEYIENPSLEVQLIAALTMEY